MFKRLLRSKTVQRRTQLLLAVVMIPPFVFFFHLWAGSRPGAGPGGTAGEIFGRPVPWETFQEYHQLIRKNLEAQLGTIPEGFEPFLVQQTWDRLILREEARRQIRVSDADLARHLRTQATFQRDGRFTPELYYQYLRALGTTPQAFEARLRDELRAQKLVERITSEVSVDEAEVRQAYARDHDRLRAAVVLIGTADFEAPARQALTDDDLRAYLAAHEAWFATPPRRAIRYVGRSHAQALAQLPPATEEEIAQAQAQRPDEVANTIRQRLQEERAQKSLTDLALDLQDDVDAGLALEAIAASRGLELGQLPTVIQGAVGSEGGPSPEALAAAFEAPIGQLTRVVHTPAGVFLLEPTQEFPPHLPPFEEVRERVAARAAEDRAREAARARATQLRAGLLAKEAEGLTFEAAAAALGTMIQRPEPFTRLEPAASLGQAPSVTDALAEAPIGNLTDVVEAPQGFVIAAVEDRAPFDEAAFANDRAGVRADLLATKQDAHLREWLESLRGRARLNSFLDQPGK